MTGPAHTGLLPVDHQREIVTRVALNLVQSGVCATPPANDATCVTLISVTLKSS